MSPKMHELAELVAERHGVSLAELRGSSHARRFARPRHEAFSLIRAACGYSYPRIGKYFGRDHTTVLWGIRSHQARLAGKPLKRARYPQAQPIVWTRQQVPVSGTAEAVQV